MSNTSSYKADASSGYDSEETTPTASVGDELNPDASEEIPAAKDVPKTELETDTTVTVRKPSNKQRKKLRDSQIMSMLGKSYYNYNFYFSLHYMIICISCCSVTPQQSLFKFCNAALIVIDECCNLLI